MLNMVKVITALDIMKVNESDVACIDFELQAERGDNFLCLHC